MAPGAVRRVVWPGAAARKLSVAGQRLWSNVGRRIGTERRGVFAERLLAFVQALARHNSVRTANAMAFDLFLALVPALGLAGWAVSALLARSPSALLEGSILLRLTPHEFSDFLDDHVGAFSNGAFAPLALLSAWWLWSSAFVTAIGVFEETLDSEKRTWLEVRVLSLGFALIAMVLVVCVAALTVAASFDLFAFVDALPLGRRALRYAVSAASAVVLTGFLALFYRYSILKPGVQRRIWPGALLAVGLGTTASVGLAAYAPSLGRYTLFYGSLAAVVVVLVWLWLCCSALLIGAELNSALELRAERTLRTARDFRAALARASGPPRPGPRVSGAMARLTGNESARPSAPAPEAALWVPEGFAGEQLSPITPEQTPLDADERAQFDASEQLPRPRRPAPGLAQERAQTSPDAAPFEPQAQPAKLDQEAQPVGLDQEAQPAGLDQRAAAESLLPTQTPKSTGNPGGV